MFRLILSLVLLLQLSTPQIRWKSEVKEAPEGNQIVLTGELDPGIDHVTGTVSYMPCAGDACYSPVDWDFDLFIKSGKSLLNSSASGDNRATAAVPSGNRATLGTVRGRGPSSDGRGPAEQDVFRGGTPSTEKTFPETEPHSMTSRPRERASGTMASCWRPSEPMRLS